MEESLLTNGYTDARRFADVPNPKLEISKSYRAKKISHIFGVCVIGARTSLGCGFPGRNAPPAGSRP